MNAPIGDRPLVICWSCPSCETFGSDQLPPGAEPSCWWCKRPARVIGRNVERPPYAPGIYSPTFASIFAT